jgi:hypothetical protein
MVKPQLPEVRVIDAPVAREPGSGRHLWPRRERVIRRGIVATVLAPLAGAAAVLLVALGLVAIGTNWWTSFKRDLVFGRAVQPDGTAVAIDTGQPLEETVTILLRDGDGTLRRLIVERTAADRFVNETLRLLDRERERQRTLAAAEVTALLAEAFADADQAVERHADWFFSWKRSYVVLKEAAVSAATRLLAPGDYEPLGVAVERDLQDYFMRHYLEQVLQPELRQPVIARSFEAAARRAHARWLAVLAEQDRRLQRFLSDATRHLEPAEPEQQLSTVMLDWDAQRFKAPRHLTADAAFDGTLGLARVGGGAVVGAGVLTPVFQRSARRAFAGLARRQATAMAGRLAMAQGGAAVGTAVQPVGGTAVGALAGGLLGLALDYAMNELDAAEHREAFVEAHRTALDATVAQWDDRLTGSLQAAVDLWFADTRAAVVQAE